MTQLRSQPRKIWRSRFLTSCVLSLLFLALAPVAFAKYKPKNLKPPKTRGSGSTITRTSNGCSGKEARSLTVLAPVGHIGETTSRRPIFAWYIPDQGSFPVEFKLYETSADSKHYTLIHTERLPSRPGIMHTSLSRGKSLSLDKQYSWQAVVLCDEQKPDRDQRVEADLKVVAAPTALSTLLTKATTAGERSQIYADAGFWYDALGEALAGSNTQIATLLKELVDTETQSAAISPDQDVQEWLKQQTEQLNQIFAIASR